MIICPKFLSEIPKSKKEWKNCGIIEKIGAPFKEGNYTYYYKNNGLQNQSVLYRKDAKGNETVFLDPNTFSKKFPFHLVKSVSKDGSRSGLLYFRRWKRLEKSDFEGC